MTQPLTGQEIMSVLTSKFLIKNYIYILRFGDDLGGFFFFSFENCFLAQSFLRNQGGPARCLAPTISSNPDVSGLPQEFGLGQVSLRGTVADRWAKMIISHTCSPERCLQEEKCDAIGWKALCEIHSPTFCGKLSTGYI